MRHRNRQPARDGLRIGEHLADCVDRAARHVGSFEQRDPVGGRACGENRFQQVNDCLAIVDPARIGDEARIGRQMVEFRRAAKAGELAIVGDGQNQVSIGCRKNLIGHDIGMRVAEPGRRRAAHQIIRGLVGERGVGLQHP